MKHRVVMRWYERELQQLRGMHEAGDNVEYMAKKLGRSNKAVENKLYHLGLTPKWKGERQ